MAWICGEDLIIIQEDTNYVMQQFRFVPWQEPSLKPQNYNSICGGKSETQEEPNKLSDNADTAFGCRHSGKDCLPALAVSQHPEVHIYSHRRWIDTI